MLASSMTIDHVYICATNQLQDLPSRPQQSGGDWSSLPIRVLQPGELRGWRASSSFCCSISSSLERYGRRGFSVVGPHMWNPLDGIMETFCSDCFFFSWSGRRDDQRQHTSSVSIHLLDKQE